MAMHSAKSNPMKFTVVNGTFWVTVEHIVSKEDEAHIASVHSGYGDSWRAAKHNFWEGFKTDYPNVFLTIPDKGDLNHG